MTEGRQQWMLWAALVVSIVAYQLWPYIPKWEFNGIERKPYYIGIALFIMMLCLFIYIKLARCFITIALLVLSSYNVLDEVFFNPGEYVWYEWALVVVTSIGWYAIKKVREFDEVSKR